MALIAAVRKQKVQYNGEVSEAVSQFPIACYNQKSFNRTVLRSLDFQLVSLITRKRGEHGILSSVRRDTNHGTHRRKFRARFEQMFA